MESFKHKAKAIYNKIRLSSQFKKVKPKNLTQKRYSLKGQRTLDCRNQIYLIDLSLLYCTQILILIYLKFCKY